jgi:hypothetical protein
MSQAQKIPRIHQRHAPMPAGHLKALSMTPRIWKRHASPWSVYTRMATLPVLILAIWSHIWLGNALASLAVLAVLAWLWVNPRLFPAPRQTDNWASKATFGERIWLNRLVVPIPEQEAKTALVLTLVASVGFLTAVYGAAINDLMITITGIIVTYAGKLVFMNRMTHLYDQMRASHPLYKFWTVAPDNDDSKHAKSA